MRKLTLFGKVLVIKSLALPQLIYRLNILDTHADAIKWIETIMFEFLWGKKERIKSKTLIGKTENGGISMPDLESIAMASKAAWVSRMSVQDNLSINIVNYYLKPYGLNVGILKNVILLMIKK